MRRCVLLLLVSFCVCLLVGAGALAKPQEGKLQEALVQAKQFKIEDPGMKNLVKLERVVAPLVQEAEGKGRSSLMPQILMVLGDLYETAFRKRGYSLGRDRAIYFYQQLADRFKGEGDADKALLRIGDLKREGGKDLAGAQAAYRLLISRYPKSELVVVAKQRMKGEEPKVDSPVTAPKEVSTTKVVSEARKEVEPEEEALRPVVPDIGKELSGREIVNREDTVVRPLIVIDAGHGGEDSGAIGVDGLREKDLTLKLALMVRDLLQERLRARTVLTRDHDVFIPLPERTAIANSHNADLFISIHANASELKSASGIETYYLDNTQDKASLKLADRENLSLKFSGGSKKEQDLSFILGDVIQNAKLEDSIALAHQLQSFAVKTLSSYYRGVNDLGVKKAPFYVLVGAHMPCVLIEVSFIDHPVEGRNLADRKYQKLLAQAIYSGVRQFFYKRSK